LGLYDSAQNPILTNQGLTTGFAGEVDIHLNGSTTTTAFPTPGPGPSVVSFRLVLPVPPVSAPVVSPNPAALQGFLFQGPGSPRNTALDVVLTDPTPQTHTLYVFWGDSNHPEIITLGVGSRFKVQGRQSRGAVTHDHLRVVPRGRVARARRTDSLLLPTPSRPQGLTLLSTHR
jgi:hypothetical protein